MKTLTIIISLLFYNALAAQNRQELEHQSTLFYKFFTTRNYDSLINYVHPDTFKTKTKESFIYSLQSLQEAREGVKISTVHVPPNFKFGEIKELYGRYYSIIYYDIVLSIQVIDPMQSFEEEILIKLYHRQFGTENVRYNPHKKIFTVKQRLKDVAIADEKTKYNWKFYNQITDVKLREELGL